MRDGRYEFSVVGGKLVARLDVINYVVFKGRESVRPELEAAEARATALASRVEALEAALRPFAEAYYVEAHMGSGRVLKAPNGHRPEVVEAARAALATPTTAVKP
jgi:hypothetical protein